VLVCLFQTLHPREKITPQRVYVNPVYRLFVDFFGLEPDEGSVYRFDLWEVVEDVRSVQL
jgi:hypothetical protein